MRVTLLINGEHRDLHLEPHRTLADVLRHEVGLTSAPVGCADGTCGTCTVLYEDEAIRSCMMLAVQADGADVRSVDRP